MQSYPGPEVIFWAFEVKVVANAATWTLELKQNDVLGKYDSFHYILIEDHQR